MLGWLKWNSGRRRTGQQLYERIVAQSRNPSLFEACGVPDTMDGRLEMILLHTVLVLERLRLETEMRDVDAVRTRDKLRAALLSCQLPGATAVR